MITACLENYAAYTRQRTEKTQREYEACRRIERTLQQTEDDWSDSRQNVRRNRAERSCDWLLKAQRTSGNKPFPTDKAARVSQHRPQPPAEHPNVS